MKKLLILVMLTPIFFAVNAENTGTTEEEARWRKEAEEEILLQEKVDAEKTRVEAENKRIAKVELERVMHNINLDPGQFIIAPRAFLEIVKPFKIREKEWRQLQEFQVQKKWSEMYSLMSWLDRSAKDESATLKCDDAPSVKEINHVVTSFSNQVFTLIIEWKDLTLYHELLYDGYAIYRPDVGDESHLVQCNKRHPEAFADFDRYKKEKWNDLKSWNVRVSLSCGAYLEHRCSRGKVLKSLTGGRYIVMPWAKKDRLDEMVRDEYASIGEKQAIGELSRLEAREHADQILIRYRKEMLDVDNCTERDMLYSRFPFYFNGVSARNYNLACLCSVTESAYSGEDDRLVGSSCVVFGEEWIVDRIFPRQNYNADSQKIERRFRYRPFKLSIDDSMLNGKISKYEVLVQRKSDGKTIVPLTRLEW